MQSVVSQSRPLFAHSKESFQTDVIPSELSKPHIHKMEESCANVFAPLKQHCPATAVLSKTSDQAKGTLELDQKYRIMHKLRKQLGLPSNDRFCAIVVAVLGANRDDSVFHRGRAHYR